MIFLSSPRSFHGIARLFSHMNRDFTQEHSVVIALGSNLGDSVKIMNDSFNYLQRLGKIESTSHLYESKPKYYLDQPSFLNAACLIKTDLTPDMLLQELKDIESKIGRIKTIENGPRLVDLDIIFYDDMVYTTPTESTELSLNIPHIRMHERAFVLKPVHDIIPSYIHPLFKKSIHQLWQELPLEEKQEIKRVFPLGYTCTREKKRRLLSMNKDFYMCGILNITPDSFSDGGKYNHIDSAVQQVHRMIQDGAHIIDIGGESTRPGALDVEGHEEIARVVPVIQAIREEGLDCIISVDTRRSIVAANAIAVGADMINDVSGGSFDVNMIPLSRKTGIPMSYMHMRGTPQTMTQSQYTTYNNVIEDIYTELEVQLQHGGNIGIPKWMQMVDPGYGFAKTGDINQYLLQPAHLRTLRHKLHNRLMMIGVSRKRFLESLLLHPDEYDLSMKAGIYTEEKNITPEDRDYATIGACISALSSTYYSPQQEKSESIYPDQELGSLIFRVHNVKAVSEACHVYSSIMKQQNYK